MHRAMAPSYSSLSTLSFCSRSPTQYSIPSLAFQPLNYHTLRKPRSRLLLFALLHWMTTALSWECSWHFRSWLLTICWPSPNTYIHQHLHLYQTVPFILVKDSSELEYVGVVVGGGTWVSRRSIQWSNGLTWLCIHPEHLAFPTDIPVLASEATD